MPPPLQPFDARGQRIGIGDRVRIVGVPDLSTMSATCRAESEPVFRHIRGTCKRVRGFNQFGHVELCFGIRRGRYAGYHGVAIEPWLLLVQRHNDVA